MKLKPGPSVRHSQYGWGTIREHDGSQTLVYFHSVGVKKFVTSLIAFALVGRAASQIGKGFTPHLPGSDRNRSENSRPKET